VILCLSPRGATGKENITELAEKRKGKGEKRKFRNATPLSSRNITLLERRGEKTMLGGSELAFGEEGAVNKGECFLLLETMLKRCQEVRSGRKKIQNQGGGGKKGGRWLPNNCSGDRLHAVGRKGGGKKN